MICQRCQTWVPDTVNFCPHCGSPRSDLRPDGPAAPISSGPEIVPIPSLSPQVLPVVGLRPGERAFQVWRAGLDQGFSSDEDMTSTSLSGVLLATDQRLIFLQEKGLLNKTYRQLVSVEWGQIASHRVTSLLRIKGLEVQLRAGGQRHRFGNLYEVDALTLGPLPPWPADRAQRLLDHLAQRQI